MVAQTAFPQTSLDLQILLQDRLEMQPKEFEKKFDIEETEDKLILKVHRDGSGKFVWLETHIWSVTNDYVREVGGSYFKPERKWEIPLKDGTDSEGAYKEAPNEIPTPPEVKPYEDMRKRIEEKLEGPIPLKPATHGSLIIDEEYEKLLPPLPKTEYELLKESIQKIGLLNPVVINKEKTVLDGRNRYKICLELGIEPKTETRDFPNKLEEKRFVIVANLRRRHLNTFQRAELGVPLLEIETELAKQRKAQAEGQPRGIKSLISSNELERGQARDIVAKEVMLSPTTFQRALVVIEKAPEDLKEKVRKGKTSITHAYKMIQRTQKPQETPALPEGEFDIVYADPPWRYNVNHLRASPEKYYPSMALEEICSLNVPTSENGVLFLWATNPMLEDALQVMKAWGFKYKTNLAWVKNKFGTGFYVRGQHELLLIGVKGNTHGPEQSNRPPSILNAPVRKHSQKPDEVYEIIEKMYPNSKFLELFARNKREGWEAWGNEV